MKIFQKGLLFVVMPLSLNLFWFGIFYDFVQKATFYVDRENEACADIVALADAISSVNELFIDSTNYLMSDGTSSARESLNQKSEELFAKLGKLKIVAARDKDQDTSSQIKVLVDDIAKGFRTIPALQNKFDAHTFAYDVTEGISNDLVQSETENMVKLLNVIKERELQFDRLVAGEGVERNRIQLTVLIGLILNFLVACLLLLLFRKDITYRVAALVQKAERLADKEIEEQAPQGGDELTMLDRELSDIKAELIKSAAFRKGLMAMIASDIERPLAECNVSIDRLEKSGYANDGQNSIKQLISLKMAVGTCRRLVQDLLLIESLETGEMPIAPQAADTYEVVEGAVGLVKNLANVKNISITNQVAHKTVQMDSSRIQQVLVNLLANAIKFSPAGEKITIASQVDGRRVRISVIDKGSGLDKSMRSKVFQKFYQTQDGKKAGGTGLGLAICKQIVEAHGGIVGVVSAPGQGSTFWFEIPLEQN